jgi:calcineurin-like phosphoesterase family protein
MLPHRSGPKEYERYVRKLNGTIYLTTGNHDRIDAGEYDVDGVIRLVVREKMMVVVDAVKIYAEHYPCLAFNGDYQVFGHIHTLSDGTCYGIEDLDSRLGRNQYDVGVDQNDYRPISYWELCDIFRKKACGKPIR